MDHKAIVIGNGESRKGLNFTLINKLYTIIGCNALHRDLEVDHLVCVDNKMAIEALNNTSIKNTKIYTRTRWVREGLLSVPSLPYSGSSRPDKEEHWGSGPYALLLACNLKFDEIILIGFDLYGCGDRVNNIYKNSINYKGDLSPAVDHSYWVYQIAKIFEYFPNIKFKVLNSKGWNMPNEWNKQNVSFELFSNDWLLTLNKDAV